MKNLIRLLLLAIVAAAGYWLWTIFFPSPEKVVLGKIASLASTATFGASDSNIARASKASSVVGYFSDDAQIVLEASGYSAHTLTGRDEIREAAIAGFGGLSALKVEFLDATASVTADKQSAEVNCTARVVIGNGSDSGIQEMRFQLRKIEGDWRITRAETIKTLQ